MARVRSVVGSLGVVAFAALAFGCDSSSPTAPSPSREPVAGDHAATLLAGARGPGEPLSIASAPDGSTLKAGAPTAQSPINDEVVGESLMPTLTIVNVGGTFVASAFDYRFEVHTRNGGSGLVGTLGVNAVLTHSGTVAGGGDGTTSYAVPNALDEGVGYQWRARAERDGRYGPWSDWGLFQTPVLATIAAPTPLDPVDGSNVFELRPVLQAGNGATTGNVGTVAMTFTIATDSQLTNVIDTVTQNAGDHDLTFAPAGAGGLGTFHLREQRTSVRPTQDLPFETTIFWNAQATSEDGRVVSDSSVVFSFTTPAEGLGGGGDQFDLSQVIWLHHDVSNWPITSTITNVTIGNPPICFPHSMAGGWPKVQAGGTTVEGNVWVIFQVDGQWYAATWEWLRPGQTCKGLKGSDLASHIKVAPGDSWSPKSGETVYFFVSTPARFGPQGPKNERSNVFCTIWP